MSSTPGSGFNEDGMGVEEALIVIALVCAFIIVLVILRFGCNLFIDIFILCDPYEARLTLSEWRDWICPCFKGRLVTPAGRTVDDLELSPREPYAESVLLTLNMETRQRVMELLFPERIVSPKDLEDWQQQEVEADDASSSHHTVSCSICLHDIEIGNTVFVAPRCHHVFHRSCIVPWCSNNTHNVACPYCRQSILNYDDVTRVVEELSV